MGRSLRQTRVRVLPLILFLTLLLPAIPSPPAVALDTVVPIVFPVAGKNSFQNDFGAPRSGGRRHEGVDIMAAKMTPVVAAVSGTVDWLNDGTEGNSYMLLLRGDDGNDYLYIHLNNDTPGTDDGKGGPQYAYTAGLKDGDRVYAGRVIAYVGDSGNAEDVAPQLHFELHLGGYKNPVNPYASLVQAKQSAIFSDTKPLDWFFPYLGKLTLAGAINGYPDGSFRPASLISRAEFVKLAVLARGIKPTESYQGFFTDLPSDSWSWRFVEAARAAGFVEGEATGRFRPDDPISREEMAKMAVIAAGIPETTQTPQFSDLAVGTWSYGYVAMAQATGMINGYPDGLFRPGQATTRAEATKVVASILKEP